jgi:hypothetical protein
VSGKRRPGQKAGSDAIMFGLSFSIFLNPKKLN